MRLQNLLLLLTLGPTLAAQDKAPSDAPRSIPASEVRRVLLLARDAALEQERAEDGTLGGRLPGSLQTLMAGFRSIDDWKDALALQQRVNKIHKADVLYPPPHATLADYKQLQTAARQLSKYDRDTGLQRIISQELNDGLFDDAEQVAASISYAFMQSDAYTNIALFLWKQGKKDAADRAFKAATEAASRIETGYGENDDAQRQAEQLAGIAHQRDQAGDKVGALAMLADINAMVLSAEGYQRDRLCQTFVLTQAELGRFEEARRSITCIDTQDNRDFAEHKITEEEITQLEPVKAIARALVEPDAGLRVGWLAEIGFQQAEAGNKTVALTAIEEAMKAFPSLGPGD